jgi:hypothetical protein
MFFDGVTIVLAQLTPEILVQEIPDVPMVPHHTSS